MVRDLEALEKILEKQTGAVQRNPYLLSYTVNANRLVIFKDGRVLVHGTKDVSEARALYHKYLG